MKKTILVNAAFTHINVTVGWDVSDLNDELRVKLLGGIVHFSFQKKDGSIREAFGTLKADLISTPSGEGLKINPEIVATYFDIEAKAWRSYTIANLIAIY
jgi:hypothetical protein